MSDVHPLIEARGVSRILQETVPVTLVRDIDISVSQGEFVSVTGPSGSGKSSLLYLLGLLDVPTSGNVFLDGQDTTGLDADALAAMRLRKIGFVFQFHFLLPEFSVLQNVMLLILADEPTGNLDSKNSQIVQEIFAKLVREEGRTVVAVTHEPGFAEATDRDIHLVDGRVDRDTRR